MATSSTGRERLVRRVRSRLRIAEALIVLTRRYNQTVRRDIGQIELALRNSPKRALEFQLDKIERQITDIEKSYRPTQSHSFYVEMVDAARRSIPEDQLLFMHKWQWKQLFGDLETAVPTLRSLAEHTRLSMDVHGHTVEGDRGELRLIEAAVFEDMCSLFNRALASGVAAAEEGAAKPLIKEAAAMRRSCVLASFYLIEAYLNSLAFDTLARMHDSVSRADRQLLTEWDEESQRQRLVKFRDKLLHYPRIAVGATHPPLQENNCEDLSFIVREAKLFRDAVVHASPLPVPNTVDFEKEMLFWRLGSPSALNRMIDRDPRSPAFRDQASYDWIQIIDASIRLVETIEITVFGGLDRVWWLKHRSSEGPFDPVVFD